MKLIFVTGTALLLSVSSVLAVEPIDPLPAGKPAGLRQAQFEHGNGMFVVAGAALIGITIALATASNNVSQPPGTSSGSSSTTTTTGTGP